MVVAMSFIEAVELDTASPSQVTSSKLRWTRPDVWEIEIQGNTMALSGIGNDGDIVPDCTAS